jgi:glucokinase
MNLKVGIDIGGTTLRVALIDVVTASVVRRSSLNHSGESVAGILQMIEAALVSLQVDPQIPIGICLAAMLENGHVVNAPNLNWKDVPFATQVSTQLSRPISILNDLSAAALGEFHAGASRGFKDVYTVFVGTGVGSAIISSGKLVKGAREMAGELGHVKLFLQDGRRCGCGDSGCLEAYVGGKNLMAQMEEDEILGTVQDLQALALSGHRGARKIFDFAGDALALSICNAVTLLNPAVLVLGGGVLSRCANWVERISRAVQFQSAVGARNVQIKMAELGDDSGLIGAALSVEA